MVERHARIAAQAGIQGDAPIRHFDQAQVPVLIFHEDRQNIGPVAIRVPLEVFTGGDRTVAQIASSGESFDHDLLDGPFSG